MSNSHGAETSSGLAMERAVVSAVNKGDARLGPAVGEFEKTWVPGAEQLAGQVSVFLAENFRWGSSPANHRVLGGLTAGQLDRFISAKIGQADWGHTAPVPHALQATWAEIVKWDPRREVPGQPGRTVAESSLVEPNRKIEFIDLPANPNFARHAQRPDLILLGENYWVDEQVVKRAVNHGRETPGGKFSYQVWAEYDDKVYLPTTHGVYRQFKPGEFVEVGEGAKTAEPAVTAFSLDYGSFRALKDEVAYPHYPVKPAMKPPPAPAPPVESALAPIVVEKAHYSAEEYRVLKGEPNPERMTAYKNVAELRAGGGTIEAPDHPNQDRFLVDLPIRNSAGEEVGRRYAVIDLAGGSLKGRGLTPEQETAMFAGKAKELVGLLGGSSLQTKNAKEALLALDDLANRTAKENPVTGGAIIADVYPGSVFLAWKQDVAATTYRASGYRHRRGPLYEERGLDRGRPGVFQLQNTPENIAHAAKMAGAPLVTGRISEEWTSSRIYNSIGDGRKNPPQTFHLARPSAEGLVLILASDGVQIDSSLVDPDKGAALQKQFIDMAERLLNQVVMGVRPAKEVAWQICSGAQNLLEDEDDKTAVVVSIPPRR